MLILNGTGVPCIHSVKLHGLLDSMSIQPKEGLTICTKRDNAQNQSGGTLWQINARWLGNSVSESGIPPDPCWQRGLPPHVSDCWSETNLSMFRTTENPVRLHRLSRGRLPVYLRFSSHSALPATGYGTDHSVWRGTGKAETAKLQGAGIGPSSAQENAQQKKGGLLNTVSIAMSGSDSGETNRANYS